MGSVLIYTSILMSFLQIIHGFELHESETRCVYNFNEYEEGDVLNDYPQFCSQLKCQNSEIRLVALNSGCRCTKNGRSKKHQKVEDGEDWQQLGDFGRQIPLEASNLTMLDQLDLFEVPLSVLNTADQMTRRARPGKLSQDDSLQSFQAHMVEFLKHRCSLNGFFPSVSRQSLGASPDGCSRLVCRHITPYTPQWPVVTVEGSPRRCRCGEEEIPRV